MAGSFHKALLQWYRSNKREMPWVGSDNAYNVWLSEIILQQTRVEQGTAYYLLFIQQFPTVYDLAKAPLNKVMKLWEGLGYYARAANMHAAAQRVVAEFGGQFPETYEELISLKGIGRYTAHAILSYAFHQPYAVTDGNVLRILSRVGAIADPVDMPEGKNRIEAMAAALLDKQQPALFNQAMMDLGALICKPRNPLCEECPVRKLCKAYLSGTVDLYPVKAKKTERKNRYFHFLVITDGKKVLIEQRSGKDIWKHLYQFPLIEAEKMLTLQQLTRSAAFKNIFPVVPKTINMTEPFNQQLTHRTITARFFIIRLKSLSSEAFSGYEAVNNTAISRLSFPGVIRNFLKRNNYF